MRGAHGRIRGRDDGHSMRSIGGVQLARVKSWDLMNKELHPNLRIPHPHLQRSLFYLF